MRTYICFPEGKYKALTFSYDDGKEQDKRLVEIFNRYGMKATFNLNSGLIGKKPRLPMEELAGLYLGHEIASHSLTHPTLERCPLPLVAQEILEDRKGLEQRFGCIVRGHAYPNGSYSQAIKDLLPSLGIAYARTIRSVPDFALPTDPMEWNPTCHHNDPMLGAYGQELLDFQKSQYLRLMYVWGHSYEFDRDDNWQVIEDFCRQMSGRDDLWYATGIEIIDYLSAARRLVFRADCSAVYNPSAIPVWIVTDKAREGKKVLPGETLEL